MDERTEAKENPAVAQDLNIQKQRIVQILQRNFEKMQIVSCMGYLVCDDGKILKPYLPQETITRVLKIYGNNRFKIEPIAKLDLHALSDRHCKRKSGSNARADTRVSEMITLLHRNKDIRELVVKIIQEVDVKQKEFLDLFEEFIKYMSKELFTTAVQEREEQKQIGQNYKQNLICKQRIVELDKEIRQKSDQFAEKFQHLECMQNQRIEKLNQLRTDCQHQIQRIIYAAEKERDELAAESTAHLKQLEEEAAAAMHEFETSLESNLAEEKDLRIEKYKAETVLANTIAQYDTDIGDLSRQLEEQTELYEKESAEMDDLQRRFDEQEEEYVEVMARKKAEEEKAFARKLYAFILQRSARRIQRWWRAILARRKARRKARKQAKGKKGKK